MYNMTQYESTTFVNGPVTCISTDMCHDTTKNRAQSDMVRFAYTDQDSFRGITRGLYKAADRDRGKF